MDERRTNYISPELLNAGANTLIIESIPCRGKERGNDDFMVRDIRLLISPMVASEQVPEGESTQAPPDSLTAEPGLPTTTLDGGTGFIFADEQIVSGPGVERDIWWNNVQLCPSNSYPFVGIVSLGQVGSLTEIDQISKGEMTIGGCPFEPVVGQGFALEIDRDGEVEYALMRVLNFGSDRQITFEWVFPFEGEVTE